NVGGRDGGGRHSGWLWVPGGGLSLSGRRSLRDAAQACPSADRYRRAAPGNSRQGVRTTSGRFVMLPELAAAAIVVGLSAYLVLGGADFGAGFWDLTAGGARRGARVRGMIKIAMGPVWEANHV